MNSKIIVCGTIGSVAARSFVDAKTNQTKEIIQFSLPYRTDVVKDANGQDVRNTKWCNVTVVKNDYYAKFGKGDNVTVIGEPNVEAYTKQDGTQGVNLKIVKAEITMNIPAARILPYEQSQAPTNPNVPSANPAQGGYPNPQRNPYPQGGYQAPQGAAPVNPGYQVPQGGSPYPQAPQGSAPAKPSYQAPQGSYQAPQSGYQVPQGGNPYPQGGYQAPMGGNNPGFTTPDISDDDLPF